MSRPIPLFKFAFAAYAAACRTSGDLPHTGGAIRIGFEEAFRSLAGDRSVLLVKVAAFDDVRAGTTHEATPGNGVWLGQIEKAATGYSGIVCAAQPSSRGAGGAQRIEFGAAGVLDWAISYDAPAPCAGLHREPASAQGDLCGSCKLADHVRG